jgi:hypothetical protein
MIIILLKKWYDVLFKKNYHGNTNILIEYWCIRGKKLEVFEK